MNLTDFLASALFTQICGGTIAVAVLLGLLALFSPRIFERLCAGCRYWVNTPMRMKKLDDYVIDTDRLALKNIRLTGIIFIFMAAVLALASGIL